MHCQLSVANDQPHIIVIGMFEGRMQYLPTCYMIHHHHKTCRIHFQIRSNELIHMEKLMEKLEDKIYGLHSRDWCLLILNVKRIEH